MGWTSDSLEITKTSLADALDKFNSLLKSRFGVHHHITYKYIYSHIKIHQTILYRIIRDYIHLKIHKNYHS